MRAPGTESVRGVLPRKWIVQRTVAWLSRNRRFSRSYERRCSTGEALIYVTMSHPMLRLLARS